MCVSLVKYTFGMNGRFLCNYGKVSAHNFHHHHPAIEDLVQTIGNLPNGAQTSAHWVGNYHLPCRRSHFRHRAQDVLTRHGAYGIDRSLGGFIESTIQQLHLTSARAELHLTLNRYQNTNTQQQHNPYN